VDFGELNDIAIKGLMYLSKIVRTMCGSKTGGWSLPCVMSD
jgi:hypothetical protein